MALPEKIEAFLLSKGTRSPNTLKTYRLVLDTYCKFTGSGTIDHTRYDKFLAEMKREGFRPNSISLSATVLRQFAEDQEIVVRKWQRPRKEKIIVQTMDDEQLRRFFAAAGKAKENREGSIFTVKALVFTGLRVSELFNLRWKNVDLINRTLMVERGKGMKWRQIPLFQEAEETFFDWLYFDHKELREPPEEMLEQARRLDERVSHYGSIRGVESLVTTVAQRAGLSMMGIHAHSLRHQFKALCDRRGVPLPYTKELMGHSNIATTGGYGQAEVMRDVGPLVLGKNLWGTTDASHNIPGRTSGP